MSSFFAKLLPYFSAEKPPLQAIHLPLFAEKNVNVYVLRDDLLFPQVSGNKWRKLKYNLKAFQEGNYTQILTFGGAFSNHLVATAAAGNLCNIPTIGLVRGEASSLQNPTLQKAQQLGMQLHFLPRNLYKEGWEIIKNHFPAYNNATTFVIPEGGANKLALKACAEILDDIDIAYDYLCLACGTATTMAGILTRPNLQAKIWGFPVLKNGNFLQQNIHAFGIRHTPQWQLLCDYHFGGYARFNEELLHFIEMMYQSNNLPLDPIYTGKMMYGLVQQIAQGNISSNSTVVAIHTGGLQGWLGITQRFGVVPPFPLASFLA
ncbi:MAG: pyridoxal-phosphate dependent enzyme [Chitinophagales bacterium]|nr:1-aminocyclopropane-1-carboxylate deaminase/D-cysteine desulfhydrase [Bacteroidota bacterium]